jgi:pimeloyl-ACP methyl ester carboxylesterase
MAALDAFLEDLRHPTTRRAKLISITVAIVVFFFLALVLGGGFFLTRTLRGFQTPGLTDPTELLRNTEALEFRTADGQTHSGWFFPGLRGAPVIVICHGYRSSRAEVLTLATSLQQHRYNVFAFDFAGHGESPVTYSSLGYQEADELLAALQVLSQRADIDRNRIGLWGYSMGGFAVLSAASQVQSVRAVVVDSAYGHPVDLLYVELERQGATYVPFLSFITALEYRLFSLTQGGGPSPAQSLQQMQGTPKLFIAGDDSPQLAASTEKLFQVAPGPKEFVVLPRTIPRNLREEERREYENRVVTFFLRHLPLVAPGR